MPPKKSSQAVATSQMSMNVSDSDDPVDHDTTFDEDVNLKPIISASIQYILVHSCKPQIIKRLDWINTVLRPMGCDGRKVFPAVHKQVVKALNETFGYKLVSDEKHDGQLIYSIRKVQCILRHYCFSSRLYIGQCNKTRSTRTSTISKS